MLRRMRVLVADDNADMCSTMQLLLEVEGYEVRCVYDGAAAVEAAADFAPDACLLDIGMPVLNGYAVARELRRTYGSRCPYLVAISAQWFRSSEQMLASAAGFDKFLQKPPDLEQLIALLRGVETSGPRNSE